ncbi:hypothetical protein M427DRAFT_448761 [Gonapodya prolifera JEL478]|uniref:Uncharacterized protein n=1 Tax=Gonapodya prolifera (strain JEL478) TaxID=1344416 RepID=A0A139ARI6_GONPJ|nr:hypothetical protein M427DRAFT_448761 [Gonapodya prolifera JEL478]|eukprot:KXS19370.1 hypothetical protein M427DRAFT_448761 [Gonapodya prolifera JEL478]
MCFLPCPENLLSPSFHLFFLFPPGHRGWIDIIVQYSFPDLPRIPVLIVNHHLDIFVRLHSDSRMGRTRLENGKPASCCRTDCVCGSRMGRTRLNNVKRASCCRTDCVFGPFGVRRLPSLARIQFHLISSARCHRLDMDLNAWKLGYIWVYNNYRLAVGDSWQ